MKQLKKSLYDTTWMKNQPEFPRVANKKLLNFNEEDYETLDVVQNSARIKKVTVMDSKREKKID